MRKNPRLLQKTLAIFLSFVLAMSCMGTALAAEADGNTGNTPTLTVAEKEEQALTAQALAATSQYLRLSVTRMNLKAGETYTVNVVPAALAKMFGWTIGEVTTSNGKILEVVETNQETMTVTPPEGGGDGEGEDPDKPGTTDPVTPPEGGGDDLPVSGEGSEEL